jgi:hypothetical protein
MRPTRWQTSTLFGCLTAIAIIWGSILPRLATFDAVRSRIDSNRKAGINPTAVFYTDHPTMTDIENRIEARQWHHRRQLTVPDKNLWKD